jgi:hypothetical protein
MSLSALYRGGTLGYVRSTIGYAQRAVGARLHAPGRGYGCVLSSVCPGPRTTWVQIRCWQT